MSIIEYFSSYKKIFFWKKIISRMKNSGFVLLLAMILALVFDNSPLHNFYQDLINTKLSINIFIDSITLSLKDWVNDLMMTLFFLLVSIEIKNEIINGDLSSKSQRILAILASTAGVIVPALIYYLINYSNKYALCGWAIPIGTDIAFVLSAISLFKNSITKALKTFITALVIVDDLIAIFIIAFFYTHTLRYMFFLYITICTVILFILSYLNCSKSIVYFIIGIILWYCCYCSGIHPTISGVIVGISLHAKTKDMQDMVNRLISFLTPVVSYIIVPIFAFANSDIHIASITKNILFSTVTTGILFGLFLGKQIGIFGSSVIMIKFGLVQLPKGSTYGQLYAVSLMCGIGFTVTLFISSLTFYDADSNLLSAKIGMLLGSITSFICSAILLVLDRRKTRKVKYIIGENISENL